MAKSETYEKFPVWMPLLSRLLAILIYVIGAWILTGFGPVLAVIYVLYCLGIEVRVMQKSCVNCYYYGKDRGIGMGRLCSKLFRQGEPATFSAKKISRVDLIPDFLVPLFPFVAGIVLLLRNFSLGLAALVIVLALLSTVGNGFVRSLYACKYCKQREIGCPAEKLFSKGELR